LPSGRVALGQDPVVVAQAISQWELGVDAAELVTLECLNVVGWPVNSSFSNQRLFGFRATLTNADQPFPLGSQPLPFGLAGLGNLFQQIAYLQCRAVVLYQIPVTYPT
jgi:hypothetical protein